MKRKYAMAGVGFLTLCMAGWAALVWAEPNSPKPQPKEPARFELPADLELPPLPTATGARAPATLPMSAGERLPTILPVSATEPIPVTGPTALPATKPLLQPSAGSGLMPPPQAPPLLRAPTGLPKPGVPTAMPIKAPVNENLPLNPESIVIPPAPGPKPLGKALPPTAPSGPLDDDEDAKPLEAPKAQAPKPSEAAVVHQEGGTGRQEPAVSIEWIGPPIVKVGSPAEFTLAVRNACTVPVQQVLVRVRVPSGINVAATEPRATTENNILVWELGTMLPRQEKNLLLRMVPETRGDIAPQAWVTFTGSAVARIKVREPKLVLKASTSDKVLVGDAATFSLTITNPGDGVAEQVKVHAVLSEGLEHARGNKVDFEIGNLAGGESRSVQLICGTRSGGAQKCEVSAQADGGLLCKDSATVNVIMPRLDVVMNGPALRYLDRKALYTIKVTNPGDAPASNVTVGDVVPAGFKVLAASDGGRHDYSTRTVSWFLGEIAPGQSKEVKLEVQATQIGEHKHKASVVGARGLRAESEVGTKVEGLSALLLELVDTEDPIEVSGETAYEVRITNTGSKTETDIKLIATVPDKMSYKSSTGPTKAREESPRTIVFDPIEKLAPRADAIYRIHVKCLEPGTVRFKIQVTSTNLTEPVIKMEPTRIYSDAPEVK